MQIQNFQLSVTPLGGDRYLVRTEQVEPGVPLAEAQVDWPVAEWLNHTQQAMADPLMSLFQTQSTRGTQTLDTLTLDLRQLGQELYNALFIGQLRDSWVAAQSIAHHQRAMLRLRLGLKGDRLIGLPWEVLHTPLSSNSNQFQPLTTGTEILFSRYQAGSTQAPPLAPLNPPLKILMVVTQPDDQHLLDLPQEIRNLKAELERGPTPAQLTLLEQPSRHDLAQILEQGQYHVFHYAGHSSVGDGGGQIHLVNATTGGTESLTGDDLAGLLVNNGVQLAVFNSCRSSDTTFGTANEQSLSQALVQRGVPAVLAMAEEVPDEVSLAFTRLLYRNVLQGHALDLALSRARQGLLSSYGSGQLYWALPVLYLHPQSSGLLLPAGVSPPTTAATPAIPQWLQEELAQDVLATTPEADLSADDPDAAALMTELLGEFTDAPEADSPTPAPSQETPTTPTTVPVKVTPPLRRAKYPRSRLIFGSAVGAIALASAVLGWQFWQNRPPSESPSVVSTAPQGISNDPPTPNTAETGTLTQEAITDFSQGNYAQGLVAVEALLDRNAIPYADSALAAIPPEHLDDPAVSYIRGRLVWQAVQTGDDNYAISDARRYWETAIRRNDSIADYHVALGFAYYAEGRLNAANQAWSDAIALLEKQDDSEQLVELNALAGLAIGLKRLAIEPSPNRNELFTEAQNLRDRVLSTAPTNFTANGLAQNWLWTEEAIRDWTTGWTF